MSEKGEEKVQKIIDESGNNFHVKVVNFLRQQGWTVLISPYYNDLASDKLREIDIIAEKPFFIDAFPTLRATVNVQLFIECKYINKETVFWFDNKDQNRAEEMIVRTTPLSPFAENITIQNHHYYQGVDIAKLFASSQDKFNENEVIYKALNQSLNSLIYYKNSPSIIANNPRALPIEYTLKYPVILLNSFDKIFRIDMAGGKAYLKVDDNFQLDVNYVYLDEKRKNVNEYFIIDVVDFNHLEPFLKNLEDNDVKIIGSTLAFQRREQAFHEEINDDPYDSI